MNMLFDDDEPRLSRSAAAATLLALAACCLAAPAAHAQSFDAVRLNAAPPGHSGGMGGVVAIAGRAYLGSDDTRNAVLPLIDYQWANGWFAGMSNGVGYQFSRSQQLQYGLRLTPNLGRKESRSTDLAGMGDIPSRLEAGGFFNLYLSPNMAVTSSLRYGGGADSRGAVLDLGTMYSRQVSPSWRLSASVGAGFANAASLQSDFGVTTAQAAISHYAVYTPQGGTRDLHGSVAGTLSLGPRTFMTASVAGVRLQGDAQDSPLVRKRSTVLGVLALAYAF